MLASAHRLMLIAVALAAGALLSGCGKSAQTASGGGGPARAVAPLSVQGAVSVSTRNTTRLGGADEITDAASVARAVYPGLTTATRPQLVLLVDSGDWPAALAASVLAAAPTGAPILFSEGDEFPDVSRETLEAMRPLGSAPLGGVQVVRVGTAAPVPTPLLARSLAIAAPAAPTPPPGATTTGGSAGTGAAPGSAQSAATDAAAATAAAIERLQLSANGGNAPHQAIVVPADAPHALTTPAAGLAAESGAPILFAGPAHVPAATAQVLASLHHPAIYVIDPAQLSTATIAGLRHFGAVTTIAPPASAGTSEPAATNAIAVARFTDGTFGWGVKEPGHGLVFANALRPLDGPAAALLSATANYGPLLLLESASRIPPSLATYLGDIQPAYNSEPEFRPDKGVYNHGWLIGDETAISAVTQSELDALLEISPSNRVPAKNRQSRKSNNELHTRPHLSQAEDPRRLQRQQSAGEVSVEDVRQLMGASTPHFALQLRNRIAKLIAGLPEGHPARVEGEREIARLEQLGFAGETRGEGAHEGEQPLASLDLGAAGA